MHFQLQENISYIRYFFILIKKKKSIFLNISFKKQFLIFQKFS